MGRVLVTGANGFVGRALCLRLAEERIDVVRAERGSATLPASQVDPCPESLRVACGDDFATIDAQWPASVRIDVVVHLAARVHQSHEKLADPLKTYRATNVEGTLRVADAARRAGARRFVFVSSVKALGDQEPGRPWREDDVPHPSDPYGISKLEAERALVAWCSGNDMECVIVRPPLVYGPGVRANFLRMMDAVRRGIPLPLASVRAERSMCYVGNLVDALIACSRAPSAAGETFHVADAQTLPLPELLRSLGRKLAHPARLVPFPVPLMRVAGVLTGQADKVQRLTEPLRLDIAHVQERLCWSPPYTLDDGLTRTVDWYRSTIDGMSSESGRP